MVHVATDLIMDKKAGERCRFQYSKGCRIYDHRPECCREWSCRWLLGRLPPSFHRPDRSGFIVDPIPDRVQIQNDDTLELINLFVIQVWLSSRHSDKKLPRSFFNWVSELANQAPRYSNGMPRWGVILRRNSKEAVVAFDYGGKIIFKEGTSKNYQSIVNAPLAVQEEELALKARRGV